VADLVNQALVVTNLVSSSGAVRLQTFGGTAPNQFLVQDLELTAAQNAALSTALAATAGTVTTFQIPAAPSPLPGVYNAV
jgi:hypothetical protein